MDISEPVTPQAALAILETGDWNLRPSGDWSAYSGHGVVELAWRPDGPRTGAVILDGNARGRRGVVSCESALLTGGSPIDFGVLGHNCNESHVANLKVDGAGAAGYWIHMGELSRLEQCKAFKCAIGILSDGSNAFSFAYCHVQSCGIGFDIRKATPGSGGGTLHGCTIQQNSDDGVRLELASSGRAAIRDCWFEQNQGHGINVVRGHVSIQDCNIGGAGSTGNAAIYIGPGCTSADIRNVTVGDSEGGYSGYAQVRVAESAMAHVTVENFRRSTNGALLPITVIPGI